MKKSIRSGALAALPLVLGYFPVAMAFGLLAKNTGLTLGDTGLFSLLVFAGASQFMALDLISAGVSMASIVLATFLLNMRHLIMSASLAVKLQGVNKKLLPLIAFGITDESFSVASFQEELDAPFMFMINGLGYLSWFLGTLAGFVLGDVLPEALQSSLGIGLYAMFAALLFPNFKGNRAIVKISLLTALIYLAIFYLDILPAGWDIVAGIVGSSALAVFFTGDEEVGE